MSELKDCPMCGNQPRLVDLEGWEIWCKCGVQLCLEQPDKEPLVEVWNHRAPVSTPQQSALEALQSVVACARRVLSKFGADSDWSEWKDLADALREFDSAGQDQQGAQRASVDTPTDEQISAIYRSTFPRGPYLITPDVHKFARAVLAWGSAGSGAIPEEWKFVPLKPTDDMVVAFAEQWYSKARSFDDPQIEDAYGALLAAAPSPAPQGEQA